MPTRGRTRVGRRTSSAVVGLTAAVTAVIAWAPGLAGADSGTPGSGGNSSAAVVTPLLKFFEFGNTIGLPLACSDSSSIVSIIGAQSGAAAATSPLVTQLNNDCATLSSEGGTYLNQAIAESQSLALINPAVNPLLAALSSSFSTVGTNDGPALAPFGPTVAGLGGTVAFFEGT